MMEREGLQVIGAPSCFMVDIEGSILYKWIKGDQALSNKPKTRYTTDEHRFSQIR